LNIRSEIDREYYVEMEKWIGYILKIYQNGVEFIINEVKMFIFINIIKTSSP